jgi:dihydroorotate dehydrogenase
MPEKFRYTQKLPEILQIQVCTNHSPRGLGGATMGKKHFYMYLLKKNLFSKTSWPISIKLSTNHTQVKQI